MGVKLFLFFVTLAKILFASPEKPVTYQLFGSWGGQGMTDDFDVIEFLPLWKGPVVCEPISGGITNFNYRVSDPEGTYLVRLGSDIAEHHVMRFNELAASKAAHAAGISPAVVYHQKGVLVLQYIRSRPLEAADARDQGNLSRILELTKTCHRTAAKHLQGPVLVFWVFHILRNYAKTLRDGKSQWLKKLPELLDQAQRLEAKAGPFDMVFSHNDLLPANILDDGQRLWLIDWDYAGYNTPLFDLGGLSSNCKLDEKQETWLLENYFEKPVSDELLQRYGAMKCASLLRETMWSMVSEIHSKIDFDFPGYTSDNLSRFEQAYKSLK